jgi:hypothetical protein
VALGRPSRHPRRQMEAACRWSARVLVRHCCRPGREKESSSVKILR